MTDTLSNAAVSADQPAPGPAESAARFGTLETIGGQFGYLWHGSTEPTVLASGWTEDQHLLTHLVHPRLRPEEVSPGNNAAIDSAIAAWAEGDLEALDHIAVRQRSGPFLETAWDTLRTVRGTVSYRDLAARAGNRAASRAAASACARNAAALFVPCHRVLRSDGTLGGFRYGVDIKRTLIEHERRHAKSAD